MTVTYDVLIPGNYFCDLIFTGFPQFPSLGSEVYTQNLTVTIGGALNTVIALHRLGVKVGWVGCIGSDLFSRFVLDSVEKEGLDTALVSRTDVSYQRVTASVSYPHDRAFITYIDPAISATQLALEALHKVSFKHLHFGGFQMDSLTLDVIQDIRQSGHTVSMDCQDHPLTLETPGVRDIITHLDMFMPNAKEAMRLTGQNSVIEAGQVLSQLVPLLVIKDGANGAYAWQNDIRIYQPALPVTPIDTTGAGDVFNAGFLTAFLQGADLTTCLKWGNICGGFSTQGSGGTTTAPRRDQVEAVLAQGG